MQRALVIGGTGPTGHFIVNGLRERGYAVTILHRGTHERDEITDDVEHIHSDPYDAEALRSSLAGRSFELCVASYGRLRRIAEIVKGCCGQFISIGGVPAYRGYHHAELFEPAGLPVPTREDARLIEHESDDEKG